MHRLLLAPLGALLLLSCGEPEPEPLPPAASPRAAAATWMKASAIPLTTVEAGHGFSDLAPLVPVLAQARVVGLGESTHGTREFFQLKHRMFEFLVSELGFTVFVLEANFTESAAVDHYVLTGEGDPARLLAGLLLWPWNTEEVLALIQWMRAYNADPAHPRKLRFYGMDATLSVGPARAMLDYLAQVDPAYRAEAEPWLTRLLSTSELNGGDAEAARLRASQHVEPVRQLRARLAEQREAYVRASSQEAHFWAARHAHILEQAVLQSSLAGDERLHRRDEYMAENARWILEHEGPEAKMAVWAHDLHLMGVSNFPLPLGAHLRRLYGDAFYMFRLSFHQGEFRSRLYPLGGPIGDLQTHRIGPAPRESLDASLARTGLPLFALDLRSAPTDGPVATYLETPVGMREIGAAYTPGHDYLYQLSPRAAFDGVLFVETTTASRPNPPLTP